MDPNNTYPRSFDESLMRELPQLRSLNIAPLREPVSSRSLNVPSPLEPNASGVRDSSSIPKPNNTPRNPDPASSGGGGGGGGGGASEAVSVAVNQPRSTKNDQSVHGPPPKPILPTFINPRALERFPYSSFDARKPRRLDGQQDSFGDHLQLPIPQQKEQPPRPPFGPFTIVNGLYEPPPNAALLPPIAADSIHQYLPNPTRDDTFVEPALLTKHSAPDGQGVERREGRIEEILDSPVDDRPPEEDHPDLIDRRDQPPGDDHTPPSAAATEHPTPPLSPKTRGRSRKNVRKWTEEETTALLRGVVKCGIGNWTAILAQPELKFNKRSASNLKDRFRVCCPWAYRAADPNEATKKLRDSLADALSRAEADGPDGTSGKIQLPHPWPAESDATGDGASASAPPGEEAPLSGRSSPGSADAPRPGPRGKRSALKTMPTLSGKSRSTLASLGIPEPHVTMKSRRRSRRPFTAAEDEALLKGYAVHGFQWTLIQQDKRLNLSHRRATDLRDRFRTKFPHAYREGGSVSGKTLHRPEKALEARETGNKSNSQAAGRPSGPNKSDAPDQSVGPVDPALSPPAPPQGFLESSTGASSAVFPFPLDENAAGGAGVDTWGDNTLAPMVWDELT
ncbi:hypothetical protein BDV59DRAFT_208060 [Aspergillus ambiguus]|uniref:telomere repeat binding factor family protein n=1 Tax=Aspergillus ambiguus TaxID=176160 RepID=UPI003CCD9E4A